MTDKSLRRAYVSPALLFPFTFVVTGLVNIAFFYLGLAYVDNPVRRYGYKLACAAFALLCAAAFLRTLRNRRYSVGTWLCWGTVAVFFAVSFLAAYRKFGVTEYLTQYLLEFACFCVSAFLAGAAAKAEGEAGSFFPILEKFSFFLLPAAVIYMNGALFNCSGFPENRGLGILHYMNVTDAFFPVVLAHLLQFSRRAPLYLPFVKRAAKHPQRLRATMAVIYWIAILASATRGTIVCIAVICVLLPLSALLRREAKPSLSLCALLLALLVFFLAVYTPLGMRDLERMADFLRYLLRGELVTTNSESPEIAGLIDALVADNSFPSRILSGNPNLMLGNRGTLFKLAWKEFLKSPLLGIGPTGYSLKYGMYPHSALLELLCETGLAGTVPLLLVLLLAFIRLLRTSQSDGDIYRLLLFFFAYAILVNISGSLWTCTPLCAALGFSLSDSFKRERA